MDPIWKTTPKEIVNLILKLACSRVVYQNNRYIDINTLNIKNEGLETIINKKIINLSKLYFGHDGSWYLEFDFNKFIKYRHGLCYSYNFDYPGIFEICYFIEREPQEDEPGTAWVQIRTNVP